MGSKLSNTGPSGLLLSILLSKQWPAMLSTKKNIQCPPPTTLMLSYFETFFVWFLRLMVYKLSWVI